MPVTQVKVAELNDLEADMIRLLQQFMGAKKPFHSFSEKVWRPPTDIYETSDALIIVVEIAGVDKNAFNLEFNHNVLTVKGMRKHSPPALQVSYHRMEIKYGAFEVELRLPTGLGYDDAKARYADGFLVVTIPKPIADSQKVVNIDIEG